VSSVDGFKRRYAGFDGRLRNENVPMTEFFLTGSHGLARFFDTNVQND
jgi:hypothetical protein